MPNDKTVQLQLDRPRNWRFTTGARIRLCDRFNVPDGLTEVLAVLGEPDKPSDPEELKAEREAARFERLKSKDGHIKLAALVWCGQIQTGDPLPITEVDLLEILDDAMIGACLPLMLQSITASMGNPTEAPAEEKLAQQKVLVAV